MAGSAVTANKFRQQAKLLRSSATDTADPVDRESLRSIAASYEHLAKVIEMLAVESKLATRA